MTGTVTALSKARLSAPFGALLENPNTVIAALVLSVCVAATAGYVVTSRALGFMFGTPVAITLDDDPAGPAERPAPRVRTASAPADPAVALGFLDSLPARALPPPLEEADIQNPPRGIVPLRVIAGRPAVVPPQRPVRGDGPVRLAQGMSAARALALPGPMARPQEASAGASVTAVAAEVALLGQGTSPRPAQRPATLSTRAPGPAEAEAAITLAASVAPESAPPRPRLLGPVPHAQGANPCSPRLAREIPRRPGSAAGGSRRHGRRWAMAAASGRDGAIVAEALRGNIPIICATCSRCASPGSWAAARPRSPSASCPITWPSDRIRSCARAAGPARGAAGGRGFDMMLPTTRMVDAIYAQADVRVSPSPMPPTSAMSSTSYFLRHNATVRRNSPAQARAPACWSRATKRMWSSPTGWPMRRAAWRSMAGTGRTATRSSRCRPCMANITPITAMACGWSRAPPMSTGARSICAGFDRWAICGAAQQRRLGSARSSTTRQAGLALGSCGGLPQT
jgi:hypothetical protein